MSYNIIYKVFCINTGLTGICQQEYAIAGLPMKNNFLVHSGSEILKDRFSSLPEYKKEHK